MKENWVDFKAVKEAVSFEQILAHYKLDGLQKTGDEMVGACPIHQGDGKRAFHVSLKKNVFNCFSCKARGNVLDFVAAMEKCSVRDSAIKLQTWFQIAAVSDSAARTEKKSEEVPPVGAKPDSEKLINKPLTFQLKGIDPAHEYFVGRLFPFWQQRKKRKGPCSKNVSNQGLAARILLDSCAGPP